MLSAIIGNSFDATLETKVVLITIPNLFVDAIRNPIIARFAFRVNEAIQRNTVEDRRQWEIKAALKERQQRQKMREERNLNEGQNNEIPTISGPLDRSKSMPVVEV